MLNLVLENASFSSDLAENHPRPLGEKYMRSSEPSVPVPMQER